MDARGLPLVAASKGYALVVVLGLLTVEVPLVERGLWVCGLQQLCSVGLAALWHVECSRTRAQTCVPCTGRQILNQWTTSKVPS